MKQLAATLGIFAILLSDAMCAVVAYNYCSLLWAGKYQGASAPPSTAFLLAIPFAIGIAICAILAAAITKKSKRQTPIE